MSITVKTFTSAEVKGFKERKYEEFMRYYLQTDLPVTDIFRAIGFTSNRNSTVAYIRQRLRKEGYNSQKRYGKIKKGDWIVHGRKNTKRHYV